MHKGCIQALLTSELSCLHGISRCTGLKKREPHDQTHSKSDSQYWCILPFLLAIHCIKWKRRMYKGGVKSKAKNWRFDIGSDRLVFAVYKEGELLNKFFFLHAQCYTKDPSTFRESSDKYTYIVFTDFHMPTCPFDTCYVMWSLIWRKRIFNHKSRNKQWFIRRDLKRRGRTGNSSLSQTTLHVLPWQWIFGLA